MRKNCKGNATPPHHPPTFFTKLGPSYSVVKALRDQHQPIGLGNDVSVSTRRISMASLHSFLFLENIYFRDYEQVSQSESVGRPSTYKLTLLQALLLTIYLQYLPDNHNKVAP